MRKLLEVVHRLVDQGNSVVVIEHNRQPAPAEAGVIKTADWVLDLGPEGGVRGGEIVAQGTPEQVASEARSYTGQYLKPILERGKDGGGVGEACRLAAAARKRRREPY